MTYDPSIHRKAIYYRAFSGFIITFSTLFWSLITITPAFLTKTHYCASTINLLRIEWYPVQYKKSIFKNGHLLAMALFSIILSPKLCPKAGLWLSLQCGSIICRVIILKRGISSRIYHEFRTTST